MMARADSEIIPWVAIGKAMLQSLCRGFVVGMGLELGVQAIVAMGVLSEFLFGFVLIVFWCVYANYFYYITVGDRFLHNFVATFVFGLFFGLVAMIVLFLQGYELKRIPLYIFVFSLLLSWGSRFSVRRARTRIKCD